MRVCTSTMQATLLTQAMRVQGEYSAALIQQGSGTKSPSLAGLDGKAGLAVSLDADLAASERLVSQAETAASMVETAYGALADILDIIEAAKVDIAAHITGTVTDTTTLRESAGDWRESVATLLNTTFGGLAVFGGNGATAAPVDLGDPAYTPMVGVADTDYYKGNGTDWTLMVDGSSGVTYGMRADTSGAEKTLRALSLLATMNTSPPDIPVMQDAATLLDAAVIELAAAQDTLSGQSDTLSAVIDSQTEFQLYAESALDGVAKVDVAAATATVSQHETVLRASFSALSSLTSLSLLDYVR